MGYMIEDAIDAVYDRLTTAVVTTLNTRITAINTGKSDTLLSTFTVIAEDVYRGRTRLITRFPALVIWEESFTGVELTTETLDGPVPLTVWVCARDDTEYKLRKKLWRYIDAVRDHLFNDWTLGDAVDKCTFLGLNFDPPWPMDDNEDAAGLDIEIWKEVSI